MKRIGRRLHRIGLCECGDCTTRLDRRERRRFKRRDRRVWRREIATNEEQEDTPMTIRCSLCGAPAGARGALDGGRPILLAGIRPLCDQCADDRPVDLLVPLNEQDHTEADLLARLQALLDHQEATP